MRLKTNRLFIRQLEESDWQSMQKIAADFQESQYAAYDLPLPTEEQEIRVLTKVFADTGLFFAVMLDSIMIGYIAFHVEKEKYDLGYCFHADYQGNGYAYESCMAIMEYIEKERAVKVFTAGTALDNKPSCKLLDKLGFICVSTETVSFDNTFSFQGGNFELHIT